MIRPCILLLLLSFSALGQYKLQEKADKVVSHFFGASNLHRYMSQHEQPIQSAGNYRYTYKLLRPELSGHPHLVVFTLDSNGDLVFDELSQGLVRIDTTIATWTTSKEALSKCKSMAHRLKKRTLKLIWNNHASDLTQDPYQKTKDIKDIYAGALAWEIEGKINFRGTIYTGRFQVNVVTGRVARLFAVPWD